MEAPPACGSSSSQPPGSGPHGLPLIPPNPLFPGAKYFPGSPPFFPVPFAGPNFTVVQPTPYLPFPGTLVSPCATLPINRPGVPSQCATVPAVLSPSAGMLPTDGHPPGAMTAQAAVPNGTMQSLLFDVTCGAWRVPNYNCYFPNPVLASGHQTIPNSSSTVKTTSNILNAGTSKANHLVDAATSSGAVASSCSIRESKGTASIGSKKGNRSFKIARQKPSSVANSYGKSPVSVLQCSNTPEPVDSLNAKSVSSEGVLPTNFFLSDLRSIDIAGTVKPDGNLVSKTFTNKKIASPGTIGLHSSSAEEDLHRTTASGKTMEQDLAIDAPTAESDVGSEAELDEDEEVIPPDEERDLQELGLQDVDQDQGHLSDNDYMSDDEGQDSTDEAGYQSPDDLKCDTSDDSGEEMDENSEDGIDGDVPGKVPTIAADQTKGPAIQFEIHGSVSKPQPYKKRRRWPKWVPRPDCRKPRNMGTIEVAMRNSKNRTTQFIFEPVLGMVFDSRAEAYQFYNLYSWEVGFGIRFGTSAGNGAKQYRTMQELVCEREGFDSRCTNSSKRVRCKAMIRLHRTEDHGWYVSKHVAEHNHPLSVSCGEKQEWNSHSKIEQCTKDMILYLRDNNVTLSRVHCIMGSLFGSMEDIPFNQKSLRAVCKQIASDQRDDDVAKTLRLFRKMRQEDPGFQFSVDTDDNNKIKTLIWVNGRSRSQWNHFGDVVTFDTTYCTNLYKMPFGIFVGVNNHFQSILFAGVLMRDETAKSFKWVFNEFLALMGGRHPVTILTDQCKAMTKAIKAVMKDTTHLWCKWHLLKQAPQELGPIYSVNSPFRREFHYIINEMLTEDEFERAWVYLLDRYELHEHPFMIKTYKKRKMWAKPWAKHVFCARMTSTQRSESANSFLKKVVPRNSSMNRFVEQYRKLLFMRTSAEQVAEHKTKQFELRTKRVYAIERHAFSVYTKKCFMLFSAEVDKAAKYIVQQTDIEDKFQVVHYNDKLRQYWARGVFEVQVQENGEKYDCECGLFDHFGIICCHIIKVMIHTGITRIPEAHILKRWTRDARDVVYEDAYSMDTEDVGDQLRQSLLYGDALDVVRRAKKDKEIHAIVARNIKNTQQEIDRLMEWRTQQPGYTPDKDQTHCNTMVPAADIDGMFGNSYGASGSSAYMSDSDIESILAPDCNRGRGRPRANRFRSAAEGNARRKKKLPPEHALRPKIPANSVKPKIPAAGSKKKRPPKIPANSVKRKKPAAASKKKNNKRNMV